MNAHTFPYVNYVPNVICILTAIIASKPTLLVSYLSHNSTIFKGG